ncbi:uncharacterized protein LTR77_004915 [Saxophila tyrrhenica]|uniref:F-box domain-containing protein n=1 Tax=Saxophila tyrrhenica TaxID=1690608 RepID=A0AAV9PEL8_9PEZI|nr:hypothetical protein LTR77_004915 [Saxophila tyrrhenica]
MAASSAHAHQQQLTPTSTTDGEHDVASPPLRPTDPVQQEVEEDRERERQRRISSLPCPGCEQDSAGGSAVGIRNRYRRDIEESAGQNIAIPGSATHAEKHTVMPFLAEHIPNSYNAVGSAPHAWTPQQKNESEDQQMILDLQAERENTKFCYRHSPDMKCRRQANEPSMQDLQTSLSALSQSDQQAISHVWSLFSAAPEKHRNLMLQGILTQCCFPQLSYINSTLRDLIKIDFLGALPAELGFKILCYLDTASLCKAAQVSQRWRALADDDVVWHKMCEQHIDRKCTKCGWGLPLLERKRLRNEKRQIQLRAAGRGLNEWSPAITPIPEEVPTERALGKKRVNEDGEGAPGSSKRVCFTEDTIAGPAPTAADTGYFVPTLPKRRPWKDVYKQRFKVGTNWKHGRFSTKVFRGHTNGVMCLQFDDKILITGSYDTTVKVWDLNATDESTACLRTLRGHTSGIRCLQFDENKLMTGSLDNTLRLWNWKTGQCLRVFQAHTAGIVTLHFSGPWVASGSMDQTIRVWNSETQQTFLLRGHTDWINSVRVDEASRTLFSASDDLSVRLWDLDAKTCIKVFEGHVGQVQVVLPMPAEFELDEHRACSALIGSSNANATTTRDTDDDADSVASGSEHRFDVRAETPGLQDEEPFWPHQPDRPAPPRYMLSGALDATIRLWDVHFNAAERGNTPGPSSTSTSPPPPQQNQAQPPAAAPPAAPQLPFRILPTDPLTNSHTPRAASCLRTFFGHVEGIWALAADHLRLVSGSEDKMLKVWDPRTGKCERTFTGHAGPVTCVGLSDWGVASGSEDCGVRVLLFGDGLGGEGHSTG